MMSMATVYLTDLFFGQWTLCTLLAGFNLFLHKIVLDIEIVTTKGSKLVILIKKTVIVGGKILYPTPHCRGKDCTRHQAVGEKIVPGSNANCTRRYHVLTTYPGCRVQIRYCAVLIQTRRVQRGH